MTSTHSRKCQIISIHITHTRRRCVSTRLISRFNVTKHDVDWFLENTVEHDSDSNESSRRTTLWYLCRIFWTVVISSQDWPSPDWYLMDRLSSGRRSYLHQVGRQFLRRHQRHRQAHRCWVTQRSNCCDSAFCCWNFYARQSCKPCYPGSLISERAERRGWLQLRQRQRCR